MNYDIKSLALKQYFKYFAVWFVIAGVSIVITIGAFVLKGLGNSQERRNNSAAKERVYDYAEVLTDQEEADLRAYIAEKEQYGTLDIVIVTLKEPMGISDSEWEDNMMVFADEFYEAGKYGWNMAYGDGACLVDNWYEDENGSQKGSWLSTMGKMEDTIGWEEEGEVFDAMDWYIETDPYRAYRAAVDELADYGRFGYGSRGGDFSFFCVAFILPIIVAIIYAVANLAQSKAKDTTVAGTYVENGQLSMRSKSDQFIRKNVTSYRVSSSSSGGGGSSHRGGGSRGSHRSSSGRSHGGGGRRR